jgi:hypothetical protein
VKGGQVCPPFFVDQTAGFGASEFGGGAGGGQLPFGMRGNCLLWRPQIKKGGQQRPPFFLGQPV